MIRPALAGAITDRSCHEKTQKTCHVPADSNRQAPVPEPAFSEACFLSGQAHAQKCQPEKAYPMPLNLIHTAIPNHPYFNRRFSMRKIKNCICSKANHFLNRARMAVSNQRGDFYISDAVKIIIAVVLGALLLAALTLIFNDTVIPRITREIEGLFG